MITRFSPDITDWIEANAKADAPELRLRHAGDPVMQAAITQIECRRKAATKLEQSLKLREFVFPSLLAAEQCTSDRIADWHASLIKGDTVLDMTCGLGIDAQHIARRGGAVTAIEMNPDTADAAQANSRAMGLNNLEVLNADSTVWLAENERRFDTIFIDPARRGDSGKRLFALSDCTPDVKALLHLLRERCSRLIIKASPMLDISSVASSVGEPCLICAVGTPTECKEIVAIVDFGKGEELRQAVTVSPSGNHIFAFTTGEERDASFHTSVQYSVPEPGDIMYEPFPAVMKAGCFALVGKRFGVAKLDKNTHLYTSHGACSGFPGQTFKVLGVYKFSKNAIREIRNDYPKANVTTRNFVISAPELVKRLSIKEGGLVRLFAATARGERYIFACEEN